ncbi:hypothetical protein AHF37_09236, partial [Paragonimus kellicotti]
DSGIISFYSFLFRKLPADAPPVCDPVDSTCPVQMPLPDSKLESPPSASLHMTDLDIHHVNSPESTIRVHWNTTVDQLETPLTDPSANVTACTLPVLLESKKPKALEPVSTSPEQASEKPSKHDDFRNMASRFGGLWRRNDMCSVRGALLYNLKFFQHPASFANKQYLSKTHYFGYYCVQPSRSAGHSHWQNVRHTKEAKDKLKSKASQYYLRAVAAAIKAGNGLRDPKLNSHLAAVLAEAKANSVPLSTLERALKSEDTTDPYLLEVQAQGGLFVLIESCAKSVNNERQRLASLVKKYGCSVSPGSGKIAQEFFDHVGLITFHGNPEKNISTLDDATNLGIEIGASEVEQISTDGNVSFKDAASASALSEQPHAEVCPDEEPSFHPVDSDTKQTGTELVSAESTVAISVHGVLPPPLPPSPWRIQEPTPTMLPLANPSKRYVMHQIALYTARKQELEAIHADLRARIWSENAEIRRIQSCIDHLLDTGGKRVQRIYDAEFAAIQYSPLAIHSQLTGHHPVRIQQNWAKIADQLNTENEEYSLSKKEAFCLIDVPDGSDSSGTRDEDSEHDNSDSAEDKEKLVTPDDSDDSQPMTYSRLNNEEDEPDKEEVVGSSKTYREPSSKSASPTSLSPYLVNTRSCEEEEEEDEEDAKACEAELARTLHQLTLDNARLERLNGRYLEGIQAERNRCAELKLHCDPRDLDKLRQSLEQLYSIHPVSVEDSYIPKSYVLVPPAAFANLNEMYGKIRDQHEYVDRIFDNVTVQRDE